MPTSVDSTLLPPSARELLARSPDPKRASAHLTELQRRHPKFFSSLVENPEVLSWFVTVFSVSRFLSDQILNDPASLLQVSRLDAVLTKRDYEQRLVQFLTSRQVTIASAHDLALFRRYELLRLIIQDILNPQTLNEITQQLSSLADAILNSAIESISVNLNARFGLPLVLDAEVKPREAGFSVIALGKLGGFELNYSSDIDLMFVYDYNGETNGPQRITNKEYFRRLATGVTQLLSTYSSAGLCYRVDLRLRPEGKLGDIAISLDGAREYYSKRARDWELQMLIKARVAAGDPQPGEALLDFVEPAIYSTSLDFSTIETMSDTRSRIAEQLSGRSGNSDLDVKLCPGGIRDIEFLVQCLQRLHGGREPWVRHGGTLLALARLLDKDLLSVNEHRRLSKAYEFLRHLEHRLQIEDDRQTHTLPPNDAELDRLARRMPSSCLPLSSDARPSWQLLHNLNRHIENVRAIYDRIIEAQRPLQYGRFASTAAAPEQHTEHVAAVHSRDSLPEFDTDLIGNHLITRLQQTAPILADKLAADPKRSTIALQRFLSRLLEKHSGLLTTLSQNSVLNDYLLQTFELSPFLSAQLIREPDLLKQLLVVANQPNRRIAFEGMAAPLNDTGALRRFFRNEMFRIQAVSICLREPVFQTLDRTSAVAEFVIARAYRIALEEAIQHARDHATPTKPFAAPKNEMMVVALGRLGMREFDLGSDADLVFILPDTEAERVRFWTRVAERLIDILTAYTGDGTLISLDTRLRPNGREGPLVQTESAYTDYFSSKAEAWEGMAYMKARAVAGDLDRATAFLTELQQVDWRRYGQNGRSKQDLRTMRARLQREQGPSNPLKAGSGGYYDADFILMYLRLKGAGLFFKSLNTPERIDIVEKMGHLDRSDAEFLNRATTYFRALDHALRLVAGHPQDRLPTTPEELDMVSDLLHHWTASNAAGAELETELFGLQTQMRRLFDRVFY